MFRAHARGEYGADRRTPPGTLATACGDHRLRENEQLLPMDPLSATDWL